ncbi:homoserine kinase [Gulosibacter molinativorax]|uniref:Homoserine kinase n=1 Tax=Gulosibacter molinativorax TaxID=256821 RepID=A0ABT7C4C1_9MICO|nr:homoserine kinase [Gulosibacter molinativorax]MDJ1369885.1 homoserine kinase [Gulosibacter molinativorax]QUY61850.1 Homoserine kinase [Gulosibacter molinativorax]
MSAVTLGRTVKVRVPATSANLGPGFDTLGLALAEYDEVVIEALEPGQLEIEVEGVGAGEVPTDESHLVVSTIFYVLGKLGYDKPGLRLHATNTIPHGRGLGSSGAAIVAGIVGAAGLIEDQESVSDDTLLELATELEGHPDNVAPCLFGGLTIAWVTASGAPRSKKLLVDRGVSVIVLVPEETMSTSVARSLQPSQVPHADAIFNLSRAALLVAALSQSPELLFESTEDRLHQSYRAAAMPKTKALIDDLRAEGLAAVVSGAGPSVLVLCDDPADRLRAAEIAQARTDTKWSAYLTAVDIQGATVEEVPNQTVSPSA